MSALLKTETEERDVTDNKSKWVAGGTDHPWFKKQLSSLGKTARELSAYLGVSEDKVSRVFHGHRPWQEGEAEKVAAFLDQPVDEVLKRTGYVKTWRQRGSVGEPIPVAGWIAKDGTVHHEPGPMGQAVVPVGVERPGVSLEVYRCWEHGWGLHNGLVFVDHRDAVDGDAVGRLCVIELPDGSRKWRTIQPGSRPNTWRLTTLEGQDDGGDTLVKSASPVLTMTLGG